MRARKRIDHVSAPREYPDDTRRQAAPYGRYLFTTCYLIAYLAYVRAYVHMRGSKK